MSKNKKLFLVVIMFLVLLLLGIKSLNTREEKLSTYDNQTKYDTKNLITAIENYHTKTGMYFFNTEEGKINWIEIDEDFFPANGSNDYTLITKSDLAVLNKVIIGRIVNHDPHMRFYTRNINEGMYVCFLPESLAYSQEAMFRCRGGLPADYPLQACEDTENPWYCTPF